MAGRQILGDEWHCLGLDCRRALAKKMDCCLQLLEAVVEAEVEMTGVSNLTHLVLHLPKLAKNAWQFNWAQRKIGGVLAYVEQEMKLEPLTLDGLVGIPEFMLTLEFKPMPLPRAIVK